MLIAERHFGQGNECDDTAEVGSSEKETAAKKEMEQERRRGRDI